MRVPPQTDPLPVGFAIMQATQDNRAEFRVQEIAKPDVHQTAVV